MRKQILKYLFLFYFGGSCYTTIEVFWRERSHWSMFILAGIVFLFIGLINRIWGWDFSLIKQVLIGTIFATIAEFITGCIVNLWLGWNVWDYSNLYFSLYGQISLLYTILWLPLVLIAILLDDLICWQFFNEEKPHYKIF